MAKKFDSISDNKNAPIEVLSLLAKSKKSEVREKVASNPATPQEVLRQLAADTDDAVVCCVARNPSTPEDVLSILLSGGINQQQALGENVNAPSSVLESLASSPNGKIRASVASNPALSGPFLDKLSRDEDLFVVAQVGGNPSSPSSLLEALALNEDERVCDYVAQNASSTPAALKSCYEATISRGGSLEFVLKHPSTPDQILRAHSCDPSEEIRAVVALNHSCPADLLLKLSTDESETVRNAVASNPSASEDVLMLLSKDEDCFTGLSRNPNLPPVLFEHLLSKETYFVRSIARHQSVPANIQIKITELSDDGSKVWLANNPSITPECALALSKSSKDVIEALVSNSACPYELMLEISGYGKK